MATATVVQRVTTVTLELTEDEAKALYALTMNCDWESGPVGDAAQEIYEALYEAGTIPDEIGDPAISPNDPKMYVLTGYKA